MEQGWKDEWTLDQEQRRAPRAEAWGWESPREVVGTDWFGWSRGTGRRRESGLMVIKHPSCVRLSVIAS